MGRTNVVSRRCVLDQRRSKNQNVSWEGTSVLYHKIVRTTLQTILVQFHSNFTGMIRTKSSCSYRRHFAIQWFFSGYLSYTTEAFWIKFNRIDSHLKFLCKLHGCFNWITFRWVMALEYKRHFDRVLCRLLHNSWYMLQSNHNLFRSLSYSLPLLRHYWCNFKLYRNDQYQVSVCILSAYFRVNHVCHSCCLSIS
jgi:hypothetical protein